MGKSFLNWEVFPDQEINIPFPFRKHLFNRKFFLISKLSQTVLRNFMSLTSPFGCFLE